MWGDDDLLDNENWKDIIYWQIKNVVLYLLIMIFIYSFVYIVFIDYKDILDMHTSNNYWSFCNYNYKYNNVVT